jgi:hypothetical protein
MRCFNHGVTENTEKIQNLGISTVAVKEKFFHP